MSQNNNEFETSEPVERQPLSRYTQVMLVVVIVLGVLLFAGLAVIAVTIIKRVSSDDVVTSSANTQTTSNIPGYGQINVDVPDEAELISVIPSDGKVILRYKTGDADLLVFFNLRSGIEMGRARFE